MCAKLLLHTKMNYTQGFCLIFNCFRVSFFNIKFRITGDDGSDWRRDMTLLFFAIYELKNTYC